MGFGVKSCYVCLFILVILCLLSTITHGKRVRAVRPEKILSPEHQISSPGPRSKAHILVTKTFKNTIMIAGMDIMVSYDLYNVGEDFAVNITFIDKDFIDMESANISIIIGQPVMRIPILAPGMKASHVIIFRFTQSVQDGYFKGSPAQIAYSSANEPDAQVIYSLIGIFC